MSLQNNENDEPSDADRERILGTMHKWLNGEPVWSLEKILKGWGEEFGGVKYLYKYKFNQHSAKKIVDTFNRDYSLRNDWVKEFGFVIPCLELLEIMKAAQPVLEIGAGSGYITALARINGIDIMGSDPSKGYKYPFTINRYDTNQLKLEGKTAIRRFKDRTVFCSWPTLKHTWFRQALKAMYIGQKLIVVREECCAEESAWAYLDKCFLQQACVDIPNWPYIHDYVGVYIKIRN